MQALVVYLFSSSSVPLSRSARLSVWLNITLTLFMDSAAVMRSSFSFARSTELMHLNHDKNIVMVVVRINSL